MQNIGKIIYYNYLHINNLKINFVKNLYKIYFTFLLNNFQLKFSTRHSFKAALPFPNFVDWKVKLVYISPGCV